MTDTPINQHRLALQWRLSMGLTRAALSDLTGYSAQTISTYERGKQHNGEPIDEAAMQRYRLACASITAGLDFDWRSASIDVMRKERIGLWAADLG